MGNTCEKNTTLKEIITENTIIDNVSIIQRSNTFPKQKVKKVVRKSSDNRYQGKTLSSNCFNNIANSYYKKVDQEKALKYSIGLNNGLGIESLDTLNDSNQKSDISSTIGGMHKTHKSTSSLSEEEHTQLPITNSMKDIEETYSHPEKKCSLLRPQDIYDEGETEIIPKHYDINIDLQSVFKNIKPLHDDFSNEELAKRSMSLISKSSTKSDYILNYYHKGEEIRHSYIAKLICKKVWQPTYKIKTHNSLIIFDWDDTLLCTHFITPNGIFDENMILTNHDKEKIVKLEIAVLKLLTISLEKGDVYIITNADNGWVEYSAEKFYPSIKPLLARIKIISARGTYQHIYPGDNRMWKIQAFLQIQKAFDSKLVTNILCLGDSFIEMEAGQILASKFSEAFIKTVKFREDPKPEELLKQLTLITDKFNEISSNVKDLTIRIERKKKK